MPKVPAPERDASARASDFDEVTGVYDDDGAMQEAARCLQCKNPKCMEGCPVGVNIPALAQLVRDGKFDDAASVIKEANALPAICGRVCPQEDQCEALCVLARKDDPIAIGRLERFIADRELSPGPVPGVSVRRDRRIAVVGSGPAGLTCAADLCRLGYAVTVFEALHEPGGVLTYGIPEFRLPKEIVRREVEYVRSLGADFQFNVVIGKTLTVDDLLAQGFDAVFLGIGAGVPLLLDIEGENANGVYTANEYLTRVNLMRAYAFPAVETPVKRGRNVVVIGGGNVALDAARTALRLGAGAVTVSYRRTEAEMPARLEEIAHAKEEGVRFEFLTSPVSFAVTDGWIQSVGLQRMELGDPDDSGRRRPLPIAGKVDELPADVVVIAIGTRANPLLPQTVPGLALDPRGYILADDRGATSRAGVYAGGDIITGSATVISAMGAGRRAAEAIHEFLQDPPVAAVR